MNNGGGAMPASTGDALPAGWRDVRANPDIQFEPIVSVPTPPSPPGEPGWFLRALAAILEFLGDLLSPVGGAIAASWPVLQWVLLGALALFVVVLAARALGPLARRDRMGAKGAPGREWQPDEEDSIALLSEADALAAEGRFGEAVRLLLHRSVGHIAAARPDWVAPSSTARELSVLPALSDAARTAFATIATRVERSVFALRALDRGDWLAARDAYAAFALAPIATERTGEQNGRQAVSQA